MTIYYWQILRVIIHWFISELKRHFFSKSLFFPLKHKNPNLIKSAYNISFKVGIHVRVVCSNPWSKCNICKSIHERPYQCAIEISKPVIFLGCGVESFLKNHNRGAGGAIIRYLKVPSKAMYALFSQEKAFLCII